MRFRDTTGLMRWNRENRRPGRRQSFAQPTLTLIPDNPAPTDEELITKAAAIRADWEKEHNDKLTDPAR
jgi:hypothetical protein